MRTKGELTLRHGSRAWVEGNYFFAGADPASEGVRVIGSDHVVINNYFKGVRNAVVVYTGQVDPEPKGYLQADDALIAFNTLEDCANSFVPGPNGRPVAPKKLRIACNLVRAKSGTIIQTHSAGIDVRYEGNIMFGAELGIDAQTGISRDSPEMSTDAWGRNFPDASRSRVRVRPEDLPQISKDIDDQPRTPLTNVSTRSARRAFGRPTRWRLVTSGFCGWDARATNRPRTKS